MATASPAPTPNPNAMRFQLDTTLAEPINASSPDEAAAHPFCDAVFSTGQVASVFGTGDFVTVTRRPGADWEPIVEAVQAAATDHL